MTLRQPIPRVRRQQEHLLTITLKKVLGHTQNGLKPLGQTPGLRDTHNGMQMNARLSRPMISITWISALEEDLIGST